MVLDQWTTGTQLLAGEAQGAHRRHAQVAGEADRPCRFRRQGRAGTTAAFRVSRRSLRDAPDGVAPCLRTGTGTIRRLSIPAQSFLVTVVVGLRLKELPPEVLGAQPCVATGDRVQLARLSATKERLQS
jgi:hypothetical protein